MNSEQIRVIEELVTENLNEAERHWDRAKSILIEKSEFLDNIGLERARVNFAPSNIPGHKIVNDVDTTTDEFIAFVVDMRNSSDHLLTHIAHARASQLQRVYYETSALLPATAKSIEFYSGSVTEYLGDGVLALFPVNGENKWSSILLAYDAAKDIIGGVRGIVNRELKSRYNLDPLNIGVGMAMSQALVTLIGLDGKKQSKAIGGCVYRATKLSCGINKIIVDDAIKAAWKSSPGGGVAFKKFESTKNDKIIGYIVAC